MQLRGVYDIAGAEEAASAAFTSSISLLLPLLRLLLPLLLLLLLLLLLQGEGGFDSICAASRVSRGPRL